MAIIFFDAKKTYQRGGCFDDNVKNLFGEKLDKYKSWSLSFLAYGFISKTYH